MLSGESRASDGKQRPLGVRATAYINAVGDGASCWGEESGLRWQAEAVRGKGDRLYQPLLVMVHHAGGNNRALDGKQRPLGVRATAYINRCW